MASRQLSGGAGLLFKGSGFYLTDYGKNAHRKAAPDKKTDAAGGSGAAKTDATPTSQPTTESKSKDSSTAGSPKPKPGGKPKKE